MTPEELESRMKAMAPPVPPEGLRERLIRSAATGRPSRPGPSKPNLAAFASTAAAFLAFALIFWIAARPAPVTAPSNPAAPQDEVAALIEKLGHEDVEVRDKASARLAELGDGAEAALRIAKNHKDPEIVARAAQILAGLDRSKRFGKLTKDRALQEKMERLLTAHPGKALLVSRLFEMRDGDLKPVTSADFSMALYLESAKDPSTEVRCEPPDADGHLFFVLPKGKDRVSGFWWKPPPAKRDTYHVWEGYSTEFDLREVHLLPDQKLVTPMKWTFPAAGATVSLRENPDIAWEPFPGVARVSIEVELTELMKDGGSSSKDIAHIDRDCSKACTLPLAELVKACREAPAAGSRLGLRIRGFDADGKTVSGTGSCRFLLAE